MAGINLDALLGEATTRPLTYKGQTFDLPGELPGAAVAPFLDPHLGLVDLITDLLKEEDTYDSLIDGAFEHLKTRPTLPLDLLAAAKAALDSLLEEHADAFYALNPTVPAYFVLAQHIVTEYGATLADFFGLGASSEDGGESSKPTSPTGIPASTPEGSGDAPETPTSSDSDASPS